MMTFDEAYYQTIDLLKKIISIPSISRDEKNVSDLIANYIERSHNLEVIRHNNNLWIVTPDFDIKKPTILLNSHIDTVKPVAGWSTDPYTPIEEEDKIIGLGSNDAGASLVTLLHTFLLLRYTKQAYNLIFLASAEEEVSGKNGVESALSHLPDIDLAIVGEPTAMHPATGEKGLMVIDCVAHGKSGHAARNEGENAIYKALDYIATLRNFSFPKISPTLGPVKMSVTIIHAGTQHNVVPDKCEFTIDVRTNDCYSNEEAFSILQKAVPCEMKARSFRLNSSHIEEEHPFVQRAKLMGLTPFGSPTLSDQALMRFPSVKIGPGESCRSHTANEYILKSEIRDGLAQYLKLLDGLTIPFYEK